MAGCITEEIAMHDRRKPKRIFCLLLAALTVLVCLAGCAGGAENGGTSGSAAPDDLSRFENARLGVVTGSLYGGYSRERFPNATVKEFNNFADVLGALLQGKVDGTMLDRPNFNAVKRTESGLSCTVIPEYSVEIGFGFQKNAAGNALKAQMDGFLARLKADGTLDGLIGKWYGETEPQESVPLGELPAASVPLNVSVDMTRKPFVYMYNGEPVGFEIEVLYLFCKEYGYRVNYTNGSFSTDGLSGLASERYDMVCAGLYMTDERKQSVNFSEPYMVAEVVMAVYGEGGGFFTSVAESFEKTFVREGRWKMILEGVGTTLLISLCAVLGGTLLGFLLYLWTRSKYKASSLVARGIAAVYSKIVAGMPTLVILMLLFYVVFGRVDISGLAVAVIGFILTFGSFVYNQIKLSAESVDRGQTEAAYALGYGRNRAFFRIVLPQAMKMFLPVYSSEIVNLVKATSVVGYIAVNDLTKVGDIIRSNTYEAFFPLIGIALIYFLITWGISALLGLLGRRMDPKRKKKNERDKKKFLPEEA